MIRYIRSLRCISGKGGEAINYALEIAGYLNAKYPEIQLSVFTSRFGPINDIYWYADAEDLAALDRWQKQIGADPDYRKLRKKAVDLFIQNSGKDRVLSSITTKKQ